MVNGKPLVQEMFHPAKVVLMKEVNKHPKLVETIVSQGFNEREHWPEMLAEIAAYVIVVVDGVYTPAELDKLCEICYFRLVEKRNKGQGSILVH
jgi:hypothetical protein